MTTRSENERLRKQNAAQELQLAEAQSLAEAQQRNVTRLTQTVNAHRRVVVEHIRECQRHPNDELLQTLMVALVTELDVAGLNVSAEVRIVPKAARP